MMRDFISIRQFDNFHFNFTNVFFHKTMITEFNPEFSSFFFREDFHRERTKKLISLRIESLQKYTFWFLSSFYSIYQGKACFQMHDWNFLEGKMRDLLFFFFFFRFKYIFKVNGIEISFLKRLMLEQLVKKFCYLSIFFIIFSSFVSFNHSLIFTFD